MNTRNNLAETCNGAERVDDAGAHSGNNAHQHRAIHGITDIAILLMEKAERTVMGGQFINIHTDKRNERTDGEEKMEE